MNKLGFQVSFAWLFSIVVGVVIIFLAIFTVTSLVDTERTASDSLASKELEALLNPLSTSSFESGIKPSSIVFPGETRITVGCNLDEELGAHTLGVSSRSNVGKPWKDSGVISRLPGKYIFSNKELEGEEFHLFSKPLNMPFKVSDLTFVWSENYCFVNPSQEIEDDLLSLGLNSSNLYLVGDVSNCPVRSEKVCFAGAGSGFPSECDSVVDLTSQRVIKEGREVYYEGPLIYGAIFADIDNYECSVKRIMKKAESLAGLYQEKSLFIASRNGCSSSLQGQLAVYSSFAGSEGDIAETYQNLHELYLLSDEIDFSQRKLSCPLWKERFG